MNGSINFSISIQWNFILSDKISDKISYLIRQMVGWHLWLYGHEFEHTLQCPDSFLLYCFGLGENPFKMSTSYFMLEAFLAMCWKVSIQKKELGRICVSLSRVRFLKRLSLWKISLQGGWFESNYLRLPVCMQHRSLYIISISAHRSFHRSHLCCLPLL